MGITTLSAAASALIVSIPIETDQSREEANLSKIRDIPLAEIDEFPDHPFKVLMDFHGTDGVWYLGIEHLDFLPIGTPYRGGDFLGDVRALGYHRPDDLQVTLSTIMQDIIDDKSVDVAQGILHHSEGFDIGCVLLSHRFSRFVKAAM